jgi:hypothetical protein
VITTVSQLIEKLDTLMVSGDFKSSVCEDDGRTYLGGDKIVEIDEDASGILIESGGRPDYDAMMQLKKLSNGRYFVTPGETDSFGWLTGCLWTPVGIIVYG